jgi:LytR cell envelope-related transcriptional attenuator
MSDPTDPGGVGASAERGRGSTRVGDSGSPVGSPLTIVLALIAVVVGFLIFRSIDNSDAGGLDTGEDGATSTVAGGSTTTVAGGAATTAAPTTSTPTRVTEGATVIVANASAASGEAQNMQDALEEAGYTVTADATSDTATEPLEASIVYYAEGVPAIQAVAQSVARDMGGIDVQPMPSPIPVEGGSIGTATVLVMMGNDTAGESLDDLQSAAPNVQAPAPAGGATTTTSG